MAVGAEEIGLVSIPIPRAAAVDSGPPIPVFLAVALAAQAVRFLEGDGSSIGQVENIPVLGIVTIQTPPVFFIVA
jgi:hypothetical protein